jgi:hypothetical protein
LHLEAEVIAGGFGIKRALNRQEQLVEQRLAGLVGEQMTEIQSVGRTVRVKKDAAFQEPPTVNVSHQLAGGVGAWR